MPCAIVQVARLRDGAAVHAALCVSVERGQKSAFVRLEFFVKLAVAHGDLGDDARATITDVIRANFSGQRMSFQVAMSTLQS